MIWFYMNHTASLVKADTPDCASLKQWTMLLWALEPTRAWTMILTAALRHANCFVHYPTFVGIKQCLCPGIIHASYWSQQSHDHMFYDFVVRLFKAWADSTLPPVNVDLHMLMKMYSPFSLYDLPNETDDTLNRMSFECRGCLRTHGSIVVGQRARSLLGNKSIVSFIRQHLSVM